MLNNGFLKVACISPVLRVGNPMYNVNEMLRLLKKTNATISCFPELGITGYTANDLFFQTSLLNETKEAIAYFLENNPFKGVVLVGCPIDIYGALYNCCMVIKKNHILGIIPKHFLPNTDEYYEKRWFKSGRDNKIKSINYFSEVPFGNLIFDCDYFRFGVEICEDMWAPISPANLLSVKGANIIFNLSASNEVLGKNIIRRNAVLDHSRRNSGAYVYCSAGVHESTSETVFSGHNIIASIGELIKETENFSQESEIIYGDIDISKIDFKRRKNSSLRDLINTTNYDVTTIHVSLEETKDFVFEEKIDITPFVPKTDIYEQFMKIASLQEYGLFKRLLHINTKKVVVGISGGLDSTLALLIAYQAYKKLNWDPKGIIAVTMPGLQTSKRTKNNALSLMEGLGVTIMEIDINDAVFEHFKLIKHDPNVTDLTYENTQARMRTMILMDLATKHNGFVLGTGDLSELALGWCTYNGDQMSMYGINAGIPKTMVRFMIEKYAEFKYKDLYDCLIDIVNTPISPELAASDQKTEDAIGKYEVNDFILYRYLTAGDDEKRIIKLLSMGFEMDILEATKNVKNFFNRFYSQQFKRQALPDSPKVIDISLAPRSDYRMPSDVNKRS